MLKQRNKLIDKPFMVVGILIIGVIVCIGLFYIGSFVFAMTVFVSDILFSQKHTYTDVENYTSYIGKDAVEEYSSKWGMDESIFPERISEAMDVGNFSFTYYNPWDAEYVGYLTVRYSEEDYNNELERLSEKSHDGYKNLFNVTGEPKEYSIVAIEANSNYGFVYAIKPDSEDNEITYVEVIFPGKLEMNLNNYLPKEYQLNDMDVSKKMK